MMDQTPDRPSKKPKLMLDDDESESDQEEEHTGGVSLQVNGDSSREAGFKINAEYARRFEHNKKREEAQQCGSPQPLHRFLTGS